MTDTEKTLIRQRLLDQRDAIAREIEEHGENASPPSVLTDPADRAERELERALDHHVVLGDTHLLHKVNVALQRLEDGTYEFCARCAEPIGADRLRAKPSVSLCHACQLDKEDGLSVE